MRALSFRFLTALLAILTLFSCKKETTTVDGYDYQAARLTEIFPTQIGKYIIYRTDSTVFTNFGRDIELHSYREMHLIDSQFTDNLGNVSYRVYRYLTDSLGAEPWKIADTYYITPLSDRIEVVENNLRFIKLHTPRRLNATWKGNSYLPDRAFGYSYVSTDFLDPQDWDYTYSDLTSEVYNNEHLDSVWTVQQINVPNDNPAVPTEGYSIEKYAKGLGLVYKEFNLWDQEPNYSSPSDPFYIGFKVKMWMIDHN
jgi:hypothetical protein